MLSIGTSTGQAHYQLMEKAITYLCGHFQEQPSLAEAAAHVGMSEFHFQRLFTQWAGVSPKQFLQYVTAAYARERLTAAGSTLGVACEAGLSSNSRLHDVIVKIHASTPGELKRQGADLTIRYGFHDTPFGPCLLAVSNRGVCHLSFLDGAEEAAVAELKAAWPCARLEQDSGTTAYYARQAFQPGAETGDLRLHLHGSPFQIKVWEALLRIPPGRVVTYRYIAENIGQPQAVRTVATAVGRNRIGFIIPCHRVIRNTGIIGQYRWGTARKRMMLGREAAQDDGNNVG